MANFNSATTVGTITDTELNANSGFTVTLYEDSAPSMFTRVWNVISSSAAIGTVCPSGAPHLHTPAKPFRITLTRPAVIKSLPPANANGKRPTPPMNSYKLSGVTSVTCDEDGTSANAFCDIVIRIPAGAESYDWPMVLLFMWTVRSFLSYYFLDSFKALIQYGRNR